MSGQLHPKASPNFAFLAQHDDYLVRTSAYAELYCHTDPNTTYFKLRQFIERVCELMAPRFGISADQSVHNLINQLAARGIANPGIAQKLHDLRVLGNEAVHEFAEETSTVIHAIKMARSIAGWYYKTVVDKHFQLPPFVPPKPPAGADKLPDVFEAAAGMSVATFLADLRKMDVDAAAEFFRGHPQVTDFLDRYIPREGQRLLVSEHEDEVLLVEHGYGKNQERPEDYLDSFARFIDRNANDIPALLVVTQRPRDLTRQQLKELKLALDTEGYAERHLQSAWRETKNQDIAASIIGFIRQRALGEPLRPYADRVDDAVQHLLAGREWTRAQRKWLARIGKQMKLEVIVDREAFDHGRFKTQVGGFDRMNKIFDGRLRDVLGDLHEEVWKKTA